jgi:hypothetical protein
MSEESTTPDLVERWRWRAARRLATWLPARGMEQPRRGNIEGSVMTTTQMRQPRPVGRLSTSRKPARPRGTRPTGEGRPSKQRPNPRRRGTRIECVRSYLDVDGA